MSLNNSSVLVDGTVSTTGGTATSFITKDQGLPNKHILLLDDGSSLINQTEVICSINPPKVNAAAPSGYTHGRNKMILNVPFTTASGIVSIVKATIEIASDVEMTDAERLSNRVLLAQFLVDSDYTEYWDLQSLA